MLVTGDILTLEDQTNSYFTEALVLRSEPAHVFGALSFSATRRVEKHANEDITLPSHDRRLLRRSSIEACAHSSSARTHRTHSRHPALAASELPTSTVTFIRVCNDQHSLQLALPVLVVKANGGLVGELKRTVSKT